MKINFSEAAIHILIITIGLVSINLPGLNLSIGIFSTTNFGFLLPSLIGTAINCVIFYGNSNFLIPLFLRLRKINNYVLLLLLGFALLTTVEVFFDFWIAQFIRIDISEKGGLSEIVLLVVIVNLLTLLTSFAYRFSKDWFYNEHLQRKYKEEKLSAELAFLKSQVSPHFLFNTLNNLFAMAIQNKDEPTAQGISKLAGLMRYMIHDSNSERIELAKELEYLKNYIELQRLRLINQQGIEIDLTIKGNTDGIRVAPMIFIPFIENAFKHGISLSHSSPISIQFTLASERIEFRMQNVVNTLKRYEEHEASGVGLDNVKKRLNLLYPNRYVLDITTINNQFNVSLVIDL